MGDTGTGTILHASDQTARQQKLQYCAIKCIIAAHFYSLIAMRW